MGSLACLLPALTLEAGEGGPILGGEVGGGGVLRQPEWECPLDPVTLLGPKRPFFASLTRGSLGEVTMPCPEPLLPCSPRA